MSKNLKTIMYFLYLGVFFILLFMQSDELTSTAVMGNKHVIQIAVLVLLCSLLECCVRYVTLFILYLKSDCASDGHSFDTYLYLLNLASCVRLDINNKLFVRDVIVIKNNDQLVGDIALMNKYFNRIPYTGKFVDMANRSSLGSSTISLYSDLDKLNGDYRRSFIIIDLKEHAECLARGIFRTTFNLLCWPVWLVCGLIQIVKDKGINVRFMDYLNIDTSQSLILAFNWLLRFIIINLYIIAF